MLTQHVVDALLYLTRADYALVLMIDLRSVFAKIGVGSRSAATRYAVEHALV